MGRSATAKLFYGIPLHEEGEKPWDENDEDIEADGVYMEKVMGLEPFELEGQYSYVRDPKTYQYNRVWADGIDAQEADGKLEAYWKKKHEFREKCPIAIGNSGSVGDGYSVLFLYIKESRTTADWSEFIALDPCETMNTKAEWVEILRQACEALNMEWEHPNWYLTASYG